MKFLMIVFALACFGFAGWVAQMLRTDIQFILMVQGIIGGGVFIGLAAILNELQSR